MRESINLHRANEIKKSKIKGLIILGAISAIIFSVWYGFNTEQHKIVQCKAVTSKWVSAEYSDTTVGLDMEGNLTTDTDYWSEPASDVFTIYTVDGVIQPTDLQYSVQYGDIAVPIYPSRLEIMSKNVDFDNFQNHESNQYYVFFEDGDYATHGLSVHPTCMERMKFEKLVTVNVWYGIKRSIEMDL